jgi:hypothetical protein
VQERVATAVVSQIRVAGHRLVEAKVGSNSDLRCEVDDLRSPVADLDLVDLPGHNVMDKGVAEKVARHSVEVLPEWDHRGCNAAIHPAADHRSATVDRDVLRWDHRG